MNGDCGTEVDCLASDVVYDVVVKVDAGNGVGGPDSVTPEEIDSIDAIVDPANVAIVDSGYGVVDSENPVGVSGFEVVDSRNAVVDS